MFLQLTKIEFDCSLEDDEDWTENDQLETEAFLPTRYIGTIWDVDAVDDLADVISDKSGWCVKSLDYVEVPND